MDEHAADDHEVLGLGLRDHAAGNAVSHGLGYGGLRRSEHLHGLLGSLDGDLCDHDGGGLHGQIRRENGQEVGVSLALTGQCVGKRHTHRAILAADQQIDMGDLVTVARKGLTNVHRHKT